MVPGKWSERYLRRLVTGNGSFTTVNASGVTGNARTVISMVMAAVRPLLVPAGFQQLTGNAVLTPCWWRLTSPNGRPANDTMTGGGGVDTFASYQTVLTTR